MDVKHQKNQQSEEIQKLGKNRDLQTGGRVNHVGNGEAHLKTGHLAGQLDTYKDQLHAETDDQPNGHFTSQAQHQRDGFIEQRQGGPGKLGNDQQAHGHGKSRLEHHGNIAGIEEGDGEQNRPHAHQYKQKKLDLVKGQI